MDLWVILPVLFFSIVLHEFAHGWMAYCLGDDTAYLLGRLTLNPIKHVSLVGTVLVPAICYFYSLPMFGWAKPVPVNALLLPSPRKDMGKVALAGPCANLLLAVLCALILKIWIISGAALRPQAAFLVYGMQINVLLAVFNLMPIPPLDGGHIVSALLPERAATVYNIFFGRYGGYIVLGLIVTGLFRFILYRPMDWVISALSALLAL